MRHGMKELSGEWQCCANHGLSLVITARRGDVSHTVMFDAGPEDYVLERNAPRLGVDFSAIEGIVLSHGHWDHAGGLPAAVRLTVAANGGLSVPVYVHPEMFRSFGLSVIAPGHCTGWRATHALVSCFGDGVVTPSAVGKTYTL